MLSVRNLEVRAAGGSTLLADIAFDVAAGERFAIVGPNGAGKTTLLRSLAGSLAPTAGQALLKGRDVATIPRRILARDVAVVLQADQPDPRFTVRDYAGLGRLPHAGCRAAVNEAVVEAALETCGMRAFADRRLGSLSGGERQRVIVARALAQQPHLLLVDEPTNHLDLRARSAVLRLLRDLNITVIAVLHDLALVSDFADRVLMLQGGRQVACASPSEAFRPDRVRTVFDLACFTATGPDGTARLVFDAGCG